MGCDPDRMAQDQWIGELLQSRPGIVTTERMNVEVELQSELTRGRTVADRWHRTDREPNADVGVAIDAEAFFELLLERIATYE